MHQCNTLTEKDRSQESYKDMGTILLRSPKKEEKEQVLDNLLVPNLHEFDDEFINKEADDLDEFEGILGIEDSYSFLDSKTLCGQLSWDFMEWEGFGIEEEKCDQKAEEMESCLQESNCFVDVKRENCGFWDDYDQETKKVSLNLSLNYEEVLDAWSNRGSLFADEYALSMANSAYTGEVPVMEEDRSKREASVMRYKEKRQSRLYSKKIRYQVRKLNADNRPRLKGRFVKRVPEKIFEE